RQARVNESPRGTHRRFPILHVGSPLPEIDCQPALQRRATRSIRNMWHKSVIVCEERPLSLRLTEWSRRGLPCVMLHGFADASCVWNHLAIRIAPLLHVTAMDL